MEDIEDPIGKYQWPRKLRQTISKLF